MKIGCLVDAQPSDEAMELGYAGGAPRVRCGRMMHIAWRTLSMDASFRNWSLEKAM